MVHTASFALGLLTWGLANHPTTGTGAWAFTSPYVRHSVRGSTSAIRPSTIPPLYAEGRKRAPKSSSAGSASPSKAKRKAKSEGAAIQRARSQQTNTDEDSNIPTVTAEVVDIDDMPRTPIIKTPPPSPLMEPWMGPQVAIPDILNFDLTGGRPGAIIESEQDLARKAQIFQEIEAGVRKYPEWLEEYGYLQEELVSEYDIDDPEAIDASTLGSYDITDLQAKFDHEWDPETDMDPNIILDTTGFVQETEKDEEGIEVGYDPMFGPSNPVDTRTKTGVRESYMIDQTTRDDSMLTPQFPLGDLEVQENEEFVTFRKSLDIIESYVDEFLPDMVIPRHVATWHGAPDPMKYPPKPYTNNRFTPPEKLTNFDAMDPYAARTRAVELARSNNAEWLPDGVSQSWHMEQRRPYEEVGTLVGTLRQGVCDPTIVESIQPALKILGSCAELLSIEQGTVFRFHYHGLIKNKYGMACWTETLIRDCGVDVTGVVFETGFRARDPAYDGGDPYYGFV